MDYCKTLRSFSTNLRGLLAAVVFVSGIVMASPAFALPALQLGPGGGDGWGYDTTTQTWVFSGSQPFTLNAYANATGADGGHGDYAWETEPDSTQYAYLVVAAMPDLGDIGDVFDASITGATQVASGYGTPPVEDPNSLAPHGIFDTYFEIYEFQFDGSIGTITDQQPGQSGSGQGYTEGFSISWSDLTGGSVTGIHFDLFTVAGGDQYDPGAPDNRNLVYAFAPFSHDAENAGGGEPPAGIPEPSALALFGISMLGLGLSRPRRKNG